VSSNQPSLLDPEDVVHSILFWRFWSGTSSSEKMVFTRRKFQRSSTGLNQQSIPINKPNHYISCIILESD
jgi:hypothetical protein